MALNNPREASIRTRDSDPDSRVGLALPIRSGRLGFFKTTNTLLEQSKYNLQNLLLTMRGERVSQPEFGSDLYNVLFENNDNETVGKLRDAIRRDVAQWLPYIVIKNIGVDFNNNTVNISLSFSVKTDPNVFETITLNLQRTE